jgi:hypothetical protein
MMIVMVQALVALDQMIIVVALDQMIIVMVQALVALDQMMIVVAPAQEVAPAHVLAMTVRT